MNIEPIRGEMLWWPENQGASGAMSVLIGVAARKSIDSGKSVKIASMTDIDLQDKRPGWLVVGQSDFDQVGVPVPERHLSPCNNISHICEPTHVSID